MHADGSPDACLYREPKGKDDRNFRLRMRLFPDAEITPVTKDDDDDDDDVLSHLCGKTVARCTVVHRHSPVAASSLSRLNVHVSGFVGVFT